MDSEKIKALADDKLIGAYREARRRKEEADEQHKQRQKPLTELMAALEGEAARRLQERGTDSIRSKETGTVFLTRQRSVTVKDKSAFFDYLVEHGRWDLADIRAAKTAVQDFHEANDGALPPGVGMSERIVAQFRAPTGKK